MTAVGMKARVEDELLMDRVRLMVFDRRADGSVRVLQSDGSWRDHDESQHAVVREWSGDGLPIPIDALDAVAEALMKYLGNQLPSTAEVKVLREWLTSERERVDALVSSRDLDADKLVQREQARVDGLIDRALNPQRLAVRGDVSWPQPGRDV